MPTVKNYAQNPNAYSTQWAAAQRNIAVAQASLSSDSAVILFAFDCIVNLRGGPKISGVSTTRAVSPAFATKLAVALTVDQACTFDVTADLGDGTFTSILTAAVAVPASPPMFLYVTPVVPCFYLRGTITRSPGVATAVMCHAQMSAY